MVMCIDLSIRSTIMSESRRHRWLYLPILLVLVLLGYGLYRKTRAEINLRRVREAQRNLMALRDNPEQRRDAMGQVRAAMNKLTPGQRRQLADDGRKRFEQRMLDYANLSP